MNKTWVRETVEKNIQKIYGLKDSSPGAIEEMVDATFSQCPVLQFPGFMEKHPLFGIQQGRTLTKNHYITFYNTVDILELEKQYIIADGLGASSHYRMKIKFKESGSVFDFELLFLMDLDWEGRVRDIRLYFDTATFLKAVQTKNGNFKDVREALSHSAFDPDSKVQAAAVGSRIYMAFGMAYMGMGKWEDFYAGMGDGVEVVFKSNVDVLPYAGQYSHKQGFKQWLDDLFSLWSLNAFNFTKVYTEGNAADFMMHELHYYNNPDGSKRYLDVYIVQSFRVDEKGQLELFKSYNDSNWLDETFFASEVYKKHYGYPADYPKGLNN
ncbi:MAG: hypothetical protein V1793_11700 [Pseudomonadota bacterium]